MKKIVALLIIVLFVALVLGAVGYLPFRLSDEGTNVMHTRSSGWQLVGVEPRLFDWRWELLIPKNVTFYTFPRIERTVRITSERFLPSAELYSRMLSGEPDFKTRISIDMVVTVREDSLPELVELGLLPDAVDEWFDRYEARISQNTLLIVEQELNRLDTGADDVFSALSESISLRTEERFPELSVVTIVPRELSVPDLELYETAKRMYFDLQTAREGALRAAALEQAEIGAEEQRRMEQFNQYGEILTEYPVLLEYLSIVAEHGGDPLSITVPPQ